MLELTKPLKFERILSERKNLCDFLDEKDLDAIGEMCSKGLAIDEESRAGWLKNIDEYLKLALQVVEKKSFPWANAANVKYPIISVAAMQFSSRAYSALLGNPVPVKGKVMGFDHDGSKMAKSMRIGRHMSYQILHEMDEWEEEMDKLLLIVAILGCAFKKTYYDPSKGRNVSCMIMPKNLVVNYNARSLKTATRITELFEITDNEIMERINRGLYYDWGLPDRTIDTDEQKDRKVSDEVLGTTKPATMDEASPFKFAEQTCWMDLDEDGYKEPYKVVFCKNSKKVYRLTACFDEDMVEYEDPDDFKSSILKIEKHNYYTKYPFIPNPDGGFYDIGFGQLLGPTNEIVNTLINQLTDAGTMSVTGGGWLGRGIRLSKGSMSFSPNEWKQVNNTGDDLRKGIVPLPVREPSSVLFNLLGMLIQSAKELSSVTDLMQGKNPGQNQPATTSMALLEQGLQVYNSIQKRQYRALANELKILFRLNAKYLPQQVYFNLLDDKKPQEQQPQPGPQGELPLGGVQPQQPVQQAETVSRSDYELESLDVIPTADPNIVSEAMRLAKAQNLMQMMEMGLINREEATRRILEAQEQPDIEALTNLPEQGPPPEMVIEEQKLVVKREELAIRRAEVEMTHEREWAKIMMMDDGQIDQRDIQRRKMLMDALQKQEDMYFKKEEAERNAAQQTAQQQGTGGGTTGQPI